MNQKEKQLRQECWEKRFFSFGTARIFEKRYQGLSSKRRVITFLGLAVPLTIGAFVMGVNASSDILKYILLPIAGIVTIFQVIMSLWSLVAKWDEKVAYSVLAVRNNTKLMSEFESLATSDLSCMESGIVKLIEEYRRQEIEDTAQQILEKEKRYAMRQSLFQYKLECKTCGKMPASLNPTDCDTCGNY